MGIKSVVMEMASWSNDRLNAELAECLGETSSVPDYCGDWNLLMPLSVKFGAFVTPLAWERSQYKYRAKRISLDSDGNMATWSMKLMSDDNDPARCLVSTLIKILR